ncbi:telomere zinc finger-associated protein-like [Amphibalanus amphitrite]|uniref:telomere zinc finger-associated protein-like n=1 Tax=Amphibalanus amphitrite TaxID=1232801 RepID=UPI001C90C5E5|nr:telomere zinc finger-associated protein-like [Amphibalanus amphitrite]
MSVKTEQTPGNSEKMVRIRIVKELPDKTPAASKSGSHSCDHCQLIFPTATQLKIHLLEFHMDEATNSCKDCFRTFQRVEALQRHVMERICVSKRVVPCPYCAAPFPNRSKLATHVSTVHLRAPRSVLCDACGAVFSRRGALHRHLDTMHGGRAGGPGGGPVAPRRCPLCPAAFRAVDNLQRHLVSRHANWKRWMCSLCRQTYNHSVDLKRHVLKKHGLVLPAITGRRKKNILDMHVLPGPAEAAPLPPALAERQRQLRRLLAMVPTGRYDPELLAVFGRLPLARPGVKQAQPGAELTAELAAEPEPVPVDGDLTEPVPADGDLTEPRVEVQFVERCPLDTPEHVTESREELERAAAPPEQAVPAGPEVPVGQPVPVGVVGTVEVVERPLLLSAPVLVMGGGAAGLPLLLLPFSLVKAPETGAVTLVAVPGAAAAGDLSGGGTRRSGPSRGQWG